VQFSAVISGLALLASTIVSGTAQIQIEASFPGLYPYQGAGPYVQARVTSQFELQSVTATYLTQEMALAPAFDGSWRGITFNVSDAPSGPNTLQITATDVFGTTAETNVTFQIDRVPTIDLVDPPEGRLARPLLPVKFVADDDLEVPSIRVYTSMLSLISVTAPEVSRVLDLSVHEGQVVNLWYTVMEPSRGQTFRMEEHFLSLSNPRYQDILQVPGWIYDARGGEVLYTTDNRELVKEHVSGLRTVLVTNAPVAEPSPGSALITPTGALYREGYAVGDRVREVRNGTSIDHGPNSNSGMLMANGDFGLIDTDQRIWRDFVNDTNLTVGTMGTDAALAEDGTLFFTRAGVHQNKIFRLSEGKVSEVELGVLGWFRPLNTDGTNLVFSGSSSLGERSSSFYIRTPTETVLLSTNYSPPPDLPFLFPQPHIALINSGWTAFPRLTTQGHQQIWLRSPGGQITQATFYSKSSVLRALSARGDVVSIVALAQGDGAPITKVIYTPRGGMPIEISPNFGASYFFEGETLYAYWGGTLFRVITEGKPIGITSPQYDPAKGVLSYYVTSSEAPAAFTLQRTTDFEEWTDVQSGTVTNTLPTRFESSTSAGFFRLQKGN
jgi:hypothetical protein